MPQSDVILQKEANDVILTLPQIVEVIEPEAREKRLLELLKKYHGSRKNRVLVFVLYKKEASRVEEKLQRAGWKVIFHLTAITSGIKGSCWIFT